MKMATWIEENKARASIKFICPHCGDQVYYAHGSNAQLEKSSNGLITKCCLYRVCPWCGEKVDPLKLIKGQRGKRSEKWNSLN